MTTGETITLIRWTFVGKVTSLLFNTVVWLCTFSHAAFGRCVLCHLEAGLFSVYPLRPSFSIWFQICLCSYGLSILDT